jgi:hypothetical protein
MRADRGPENGEGDAPPKLNVGQRLLLRVPRIKRSSEAKQPISDWARRNFMKPEDPDQKPKADETPEDVDELQDLVKYANDKERAIGLITAPIGAAIAFVVVHVLIQNDPAHYLKGGVLNSHYVNPSTYDDVFLVVIALAIGVLVSSLLRKRLFMGIFSAMFGLAIFNMHYWGFGIPFIMVGAWYLVRTFRLQRALREATGELSGYAARANANRASRATPAPSANKRYTPRATTSNRALKGRPVNQKRAV